VKIQELKVAKEPPMLAWNLKMLIWKTKVILMMIYNINKKPIKEVQFINQDLQLKMKIWMICQEFKEIEVQVFFYILEINKKLRKNLSLKISKHLKS
jgi:hypothetical protein